MIPRRRFLAGVALALLATTAYAERMRRKLRLTMQDDCTVSAVFVPRGTNE